MEPRTFRQASCAAIIGGVIALVGGVISGMATYHLATGIPLMQGGSKFSSGEHLASSGELWFGIVGGLPFLLLGTVLILSTLNCAVTIDGQGIFATNLLKRRTFQATWSEITAVERINSSPGSGYKITANGKSLPIQSSILNMKGLIAEVKKRTNL